MEQPEDIVYRFNGFVRGGDGAMEAIAVAVSAPMDSGKGDSVCLLSCPFLRTKPFSIYGVDHDQALELARRCVEMNLEYMNASLVDAGGMSIELPPVPKADALRPENPT